MKKSRNTRSSRRVSSNRTSSFARAKRAICIGLLLALGASVARSQSYPRWFLEQGALPCASAVGYTDPSFYADSSVAYARSDALENARHQLGIVISGGEMFLSTERGELWMGSDFEETPQGALPADVARWTVKDVWHTRELSVVLLADSQCVIPEEMMRRLELKGSRAPLWVNTVPQAPGHLTAIGTAVRYYHLTSSWREAEKNARRSLAASLESHIRQLAKFADAWEYLITHYEIRGELKDIQILARWEDTQAGLHYVLMRAPLP